MNEQKRIATNIHVMLEKMTLKEKCWITPGLCATFDYHANQLAADILEEKKEWDAIQEVKRNDAKNLETPQCS